MRLRSLLLLSAAVLIVAAPAYAQNGCLDSPECPTALLAAVGLAGIGAAKGILRRRGRK